MLGGHVPIKVAAPSRSVATALHLAGVRALARVRADVLIQIAAHRRSIATALHLAGVRTLARVRAGMFCEVAARCRSVATALHLAGVRALARVRPYVRGKVTARRRRVATALLLARELALTHLKRECGPTCRRRGAPQRPPRRRSHGRGSAARCPRQIMTIQRARRGEQKRCRALLWAFYRQKWWWFPAAPA